MLVLTRKVGEVLRVGDDIKIIILKIDRNKISIGIDAPNEISIFREEAKVKNKE